MRKHRLFAALLALLFLFSVPTAQAAKKATATPNPDAIVEPTLNPDANPYDANHPEDLEADQLYALSAILIEASTGQVIFEKDADVLRYPASTTKILTVWLGIQMAPADLEQTVVVSERAVDIPTDATSMKLKAGEEIRYIDLLYGTMLVSANDGANVIAEATCGSIENFVALMNQTVQTLGCTGTHFTNAHGYPDDNHYSNARDMALIARAAMQSDLFRQIVGTYSYTLPKTNMNPRRGISNTNELMRQPGENSTNKYYYPPATGMKTGSAKSSGYCFVGSAVKDDVELISVVMFTGNRARWADTIKLMDYGFSQYVSVTPVDLYNMYPITLETSGYALDDPSMGKLLLNCIPVNRAQATHARIIATKAQINAMASDLNSTVYIQYVRDFIAPIQAGEVMATMTFFGDDGTAYEYNLTAARSVARRENAPMTLEEIMNSVAADPNPLPPISFEMVMYALLPMLVMLAMILGLRVIIRRQKRKGARLPKIGRRYLK